MKNKSTKVEKAVCIILLALIFVSFSLIFYMVFSFAQFHYEGEMMKMKILMEAPNQTAAMEWIQNER